MLTAVNAALALIPRWVLLALLVAVTLWGGVLGHWLTLSQRDAARLAAESARVAAVYAAAAASASEHARAVEQQRAAAQRSAQEAHHAQSQTLRADAARAADAADRLRNALAIAARALRSTSGDPAVAGGSETGARAAELLGACVSRYRDVAADADRAVAAGQLCERSYDALTN